MMADRPDCLKHPERAIRISSGIQDYFNYGTAGRRDAWNAEDAQGMREWRLWMDHPSINPAMAEA